MFNDVCDILNMVLQSMYWYYIVSSLIQYHIIHMYVIQDQKTGSLLEKGNKPASQMLLIYWLQQLITVESIAVIMDATLFSPILFFFVCICLTSNGYSMCQR